MYQQTDAQSFISGLLAAHMKNKTEILAREGCLLENVPNTPVLEELCFKHHTRLYISGHLLLKMIKDLIRKKQ